MFGFKVSACNFKSSVVLLKLKGTTLRTFRTALFQVFRSAIKVICTNPTIVQVSQFQVFRSAIKVRYKSRFSFYRLRISSLP